MLLANLWQKGILLFPCSKMRKLLLTK
jgi:hypothetical protein